MSHRFLEIFAMLTIFLDCWTLVEEFFRQSGLSFDLSGKKETVSQLCALLKPLADLPSKMQSQKKPQGWIFIGNLLKLRVTGCLNPAQALARIDGKGVYSRLNDVVKKVRVALCDAIDKKFFIPRYISCTRALVFELQAFCMPTMKYLETLRPPILLALTNVWQRILRMRSLQKRISIVL